MTCAPGRRRDLGQSLSQGQLRCLAQPRQLRFGFVADDEGIIVEIALAWGQSL